MKKIKIILGVGILAIIFLSLITFKNQVLAAVPGVSGWFGVYNTTSTAYLYNGQSANASLDQQGRVMVSPSSSITVGSIGSVSNPISNAYISNLYTSTTSISVITSSTLIRVGDGTSTTPSISFSADTDTGFYRVGANNFAISAGGTKLVDFNPSVNTPIYAYGNTNSYVQFNIQNQNAGTTASTDLVATADSGTETTHYVDLGINSSGNTDAAFTITAALDGYLYSKDSNFAFGTATNDKDLVFFTNGTLAANERMRLAGFATSTTAATQDVGLNYSAVTKTWAAGAGPLAAQKEIVFNAPTYIGNVGGALTITDAYTTYISGAPTAGANMTITRPWGLGVNANIGAGAGTVSLPSYSFISDPDTGMYSGGADSLRFTVSGADRLTFSVDAAQFITRVQGAGNNGYYASSALGSRYVWNTYQTNDTASITTQGGGSDTLLIVQEADSAFDFLHANQTNPTVFIHSANQSATEWGGLAHDQTNFVISAGKGAVNVSQSIATTGSPSAFIVTGAAHTTLAKNTEASDIYFNITRAVQFATVDTTFLKQRAIKVGQPTYGFVGTSTITVAKTMEFLGGPLAGTNATITTGINVDLPSWLGTNATDLSLSIDIPGIATGTGNVTTRAGINIGSISVISLGNQTANLTNLYGVNVGVSTFESTTNTRTVTGNVASVYIAGAPVASTNVTFNNTAYSLFIDDGNSRFDGDVYINTSTKGIILTSPDGTCARVVVSDIDALTASSVTCP